MNRCMYFLLLFLFFIIIDNVSALEIEDGTYAISNALDENKVLSIKGDIKNGANVEIDSFKHMDNQKWNVKKLDNDYYMITSVANNNFSLDVSGASLNMGANVQIYEDNNTDAQKWIIKDNGNGYFQIISKCNNFLLDVKGAQTNDGTNIWMYKNNNTKAQFFKFYKIDDEKPIEDGIYIINSKLSKHLAVSLDNNDNNININETNSSYSEAFNITYVDGYYYIKPYKKENLFVGVNERNIGLTDKEKKWLIKKNIDDTYSIFDNNNCIDVEGANTKAFTNIQLYESNGTKAQKFYFTKIDLDNIEDDLYTISSYSDDFILSFNNIVSVNNANIYLNNNNNDNNGKWYIKNIKDNIYEIKSAIDDNFVFDVSGGKLENSVNVQLYRSNNTDAQRWYIIKLEDGTYRFTNVKSFKNLDVNGANFISGTNIHQYENNDTKAQKFKLSKTSFTPNKQFVSNGKYLMYSKVNLNKSIRENYIYDLEGSINEFIDIKYIDNGYYVLKNKNKAYTNNNGKIILSTYDESDNQKWFLLKNGDYYIFYSKLDGKVLDIPGAKDKNYNQLQTYNSNGTDAQKFYLEEVLDNNIENGYYTLSLNDKFLSIDSIPYNGSYVLLNNADDNTRKWYFSKIKNNLYEIKYGLNPYKVMDVKNGNIKNRTSIQLYSNNGTDAQKWYLIHLKNNNYKFVSKLSHTILTMDNNYALIDSNNKKNQQFKIEKTTENVFGKTVDEGYYIINSSLANNKVIDVSGGSILNGTNVQLYSLNSTLAQIWKLNYIENGLYYITTSLNYKKALTNVNGNLELQKYNELDNQKWYIVPLEDGKISLVSANDGLYADVSAAKIDNGTNIGVYQSNNTNAQKFYLNSYGGKKTYRGIDISKWQGNINWSSLASQNPNFIIMRIGHGINDKDIKFENYYQNANAFDIPIGVYIYSLANNSSEAKIEANTVIKWLNNRKLDLPVFYDMEYTGQLYLGKEILTNMAETFCSNIISNNYKCGIYANVYWLTNFLDAKELSLKYPIWLAHWTGANNYNDVIDHFDKYKSNYFLSPYNFWQFTDSGILNGITDNTVDLDFGYNIFD